MIFYRCNNNNVNYNFEHEMYSILNLPQIICLKYSLIDSKCVLNIIKLCQVILGYCHILGYCQDTFCIYEIKLFIFCVYIMCLKYKTFIL